jgi:hypothetical protein
MTGKSCNVGHNDMVADFAIMGDMGIRHQQIMITDNRFSMAAGCSTMNRGIFADLVVGTNYQFSWFTFITEILRCATYHGKGTDQVSLANGRGAGDNRMWLDSGVGTYADPGFNYGIRPNIDGGVYLGFGIYNGSGMYGHYILKFY